MPELRDLIDISAWSFRTRPLPERQASRADWERVGDALGRGSVTLLGLWAGAGAVRLALYASGTRHVGLLAFRTDDSFPSLGRHCPAAQRPERAIRDLHGLMPEGAPDARPWLDHGRWGTVQPLGVPRPAPPAEPYRFLPVEGESLHQVPVGPVHAGIIEPGHFRFTAQGETVVRLEERLGYVHKGIEGLMRGASLDRGAELAGRISGDSTVANAWAFAQAVEAALGMTAPLRALHLRALMAELERLANHLGDIGAICNDAAFALMLAQCSALRETVLRTADAAFGHRLMRDRIVPGGVAQDLSPDGADGIRAVIVEIGRRFPALVELYDNTASLLDRTVGTGRLAPGLAAAFGAGGFVGRASGRDFDARRALPYAPYDALSFAVPVRDDGDVNARIWIRIEEVRQALGLIAQILDTLPGGEVRTDAILPGSARSGLGLVEGFRGDILAWVALDPEGRISACHLRDPSWFQWPLLEAVIEGNIIADFPLCNKSFNCSYSGHDL
jgi:Ni,Fe-hydrogenase III large subunit